MRTVCSQQAAEGEKRGATVHRFVAAARSAGLIQAGVCVCNFFYDDLAMGTRITLSQLYAAAPESSHPLGDKPVSQPAPFQTLVGHSVIVVRRVCSLVSNFISRHLRGFPPRRCR